MNGFTCPNCGEYLNVTAGGGGRWSPGRLMAMGGDAAQADVLTTYSRTTPTREPTPQGDVLVPLAQAAITAAVGGLIALAITLASDWPWWVPLAALAGVFAIAWLLLLYDHRSLLRVVESVTSAPPAQPPQAPRQSNLQLEVHEVRGNSDTLRFLDLPCDEAAFCKIARGLVAGQPFSERRWAGRGKPLSGPKFRELQDALLKTGYLRWKSDADHRQGVTPTRTGWQVFGEAAK